MPTFAIDIQYYDESQRQAIMDNYPLDFAQIDSRLGTVNLSFEDLQVYSLFRHQTEHFGYSTFKDFLTGAEKHWGENELYFTLKMDSGNLICKYPGDVEARNIPESIGVGGGLSVFGHLYGLHQADWKRIGIRHEKDLDFRRASSINGRILKVELKGSIVENNATKTSAISQHKAQIIQKKEALKARGDYGGIETCLSSIVAVSKTDQPMKCWLLDPPSSEIDVPPDKEKLLRRLYYYGEILNWISPRSVLSLALANRIRAIEASTRHRDLNGLHLVKGDDKEIRIDENFVTSKPHVLTAGYFGRRTLHDDQFCGAVGVEDGNLWFVGLPVTAIRMLAEQEFEFILGYRKQALTFPGILDCWLSEEDFNAIRNRSTMSIRVLSSRTRNKKWTRIQVEAKFMVSSSGLIFSRN